MRGSSSKTYRVYLAKEAEEDLINLYSYIAKTDSPKKAEAVLDRLEALCTSLSRFPLRGRVSPELARIQVHTYREIVLTPYRIIYQIVHRDVYIHGVLDGRRNMQELLERRLLSDR